MIARTATYSWQLPSPGQMPWYATANSLLAHMDVTIASLVGTQPGRFTTVVSAYASGSSTLFNPYSYTVGSCAPLGRWTGSFQVTRPGLVAVHLFPDVHLDVTNAGLPRAQIIWNCSLKRLDGTSPQCYFLIDDTTMRWISFRFGSAATPNAHTGVWSLAPGTWGADIQLRLAWIDVNTLTVQVIPGASVLLQVEEM